METNLKYRYPRYKALPKGWSFGHDGYYSQRWENWKVNQVEGSYVTNYAYKACMFKDKNDADEYEKDARRHYIVCEDGGADWNMPISYKQVEIDPDTLRQETPYIYVELWKGKGYPFHLWENDIVRYHFIDNRDSDKHYGIVFWNKCDFMIRDLKTQEVFVIGRNHVIGVDDVLGTKFEFIHKDDIYKKNPEKNKFPEELNSVVL